MQGWGRRACPGAGQNWSILAVGACGWRLHGQAALAGGSLDIPFAMIRKTAGDHPDFQRTSAKIQADLNSFNNRTRESSDL
jgi:hypothetical protein